MTNIPIKIHERFDAFASKYPSNPAIITDKGTQTYNDLNLAANKLAQALVRQPIEHREAIGVLSERSSDLPIAFLAILKAGCVYVPMVANLPPARLANMAEQAEIKRVIALDEIELPPALLSVLAKNNGDSKTIQLENVIRPEEVLNDKNREAKSVSFSGASVTDTDLAAILFTSGSTGIPKGVMLTHSAVANMALGHIEKHGVTDADRILLSTSPGFILGFRELCLPLMCGAAFVPASLATINSPLLLLKKMEQHLVSIAFFTPSYLRLLNGAVPKGLRCLITAGERPNAIDARHYSKHLDYWNVHGATEMCGTICMHKVDPEGTGNIPSGRPFTNTKVYLLDKQGNELDKGDIGEIYVVGKGLSSGYLKQPELTDRSFVQIPYGRAYRTHDLGRWNSNGELETLGRIDDVVKISGQSVSLGEIEQALQIHPSARMAMALYHNELLVGAVECPDNARQHQVEWREFLGKSLPTYMIPAHIIELKEMPISSAGKIDRQSILKAIESDLNLNRAQQPGALPQGEIETTIAEIFETVINVRPISRDDNFFQLGGTSLMAIAICARLQEFGYRVSVQMVLTELTIKNLAARIHRMQNQQPDDTNTREFEKIATADQENFWLASTIGLTPAASQVARVFAISGATLSDDVYQQAWLSLLDRHAALRSSFYSTNSDTPLQWKTIESQDLLSHKNLMIKSVSTLDEAHRMVSYWRNKKIDLSKPPLGKAGLIKVDDENSLLFWFVFHHAVVDGMSAQIIQNDLLSILANRSLEPVNHGIASASLAEQKYLGSSEFIRDKKFWTNKLDELVIRGGRVFDDQIVDLPRPNIPTGQRTPVLIEYIDSNTLKKLNKLAQNSQTGLHGLLLAILAAEIRRCAGLEDVIIGNGISVRPDGNDQVVGHFVNLLPVVLLKDGEVPFYKEVKSTQSSLTEAIEYSAYPAAILYREFRKRHPELRTSRTCLFDIALTANPSKESIDKETGIRFNSHNFQGELEYPASGLDLLFSHEPCLFSNTVDKSNELVENGINLKLSWNPDVCTMEKAQSWISNFAAWARLIAEKPELLDQPLPALLPHEEQILNKWETGNKQPLKKELAHHLFEKIAFQYPNHPAVVCKDNIESFEQLNAKADKIARQLRYCGIENGSVVGVLSTVSLDLPAALIGIWKAGGIYLPLPKEQPAARLAAMSMDAGISLLLALDGNEIPEALASSTPKILSFEDCLNTENGNRSESQPVSPNTQCADESIAYIIYTSGTTGMPKGVPVTHHAYVNTIMAIVEMIGLHPDDRMSMTASIGFDASLWELGLTLLTGTALVPISHTLRDDPWQLKEFYHEIGVTAAFHTPSFLRISEQVPFKGLRILLTGAEPPNHRDVQLYASRLAFWNCYGPTETTIICSLTRLSGSRSEKKPLTAGHPLPNTSISIRNKNGLRVPPGFTGEIWIGGIGVSAGYLNQAELTAEVFVDLPEGRFYRSGDYGSWNAEGELIISGRIDDQVKLNGQRVELGEIEQALLSHPDVAEAVVIVDSMDANRKAVRAFIRKKNSQTQTEEPAENILTTFISKHLPEHMLPASITFVHSIPLSASGKIDRQALLAMTREQLQTEKTLHDEPLDFFGEQIASVWSEVLGCSVFQNDNFFALGGNSLQAVALAHKISEKLKLRITPRSFFSNPTLGSFIESMKSLPDLNSGTEINLLTNKASEGEKEFWIAETTGLDIRTFTIPIQRRVIGTADHESWQRAWATLVDIHEGLRTFFREDKDGQLICIPAPAESGSFEFKQIQNETDARAYIKQRHAEPVSIAAPPLWRVGLVETLENKKTFFWLALHHAVGDGQSINTILNDLTILLGKEHLVSEPESARVLAAREDAYLRSEEARKDAEYWDELLKNIPRSAFAEWPLDRPRSPLTPPGNHRCEMTLNAETGEVLKTLARCEQATLHAVMLAVLSLETKRRTGRSDFLIGTTASVRESAADTQIVGYGVNMLPIHCSFSKQQNFSAILKDTQKHLSQALQHARYPFSRSCRTFWREQPELRDPQRYPLFDIAITENPGSSKPHSDISGSGLRFVESTDETKDFEYELTNVSPGQDMVFIHETLDTGEMSLKLHVNAAIYSRDTAQNWLESLVGWLRWLTTESSRTNDLLPQLLPEEKNLLKELEYGRRVQRPPLQFHELFERVADRKGQAIRPAVVTETRVTSYSNLDEKANAIAHALREHDVKRGDVVAVLAGRSPYLPESALGIWKAGAVYLPLAYDLPPERLAFIAGDAAISHLIALDGVPVPEVLAQSLPPVLRPEKLSKKYCSEHKERLVYPDNEKNIPDDIAYILYTSGSTGMPKGTLISHSSYVNLVLSAVETYNLSSSDRCLMFASPSFDVSLSDIGVPLACGASIYPVPASTIESPNRFLDFLQEKSITLADITPTYLRLFRGRKLPTSLRILVTGGEAPILEDVNIYTDQLRYFNAYGPTENTITSSMGQLKNSEEGSLSAGRPLSNTSLHICDTHGNQLPPGTVGEIWLGGSGLAKGYLNRPDLMEKTFVSTSRGMRYRSGDLGRWRRDKTIEIIGRIDEQIKLNGIRIELGEVEYALTKHPAVSQAVALIASENGGKKSLWCFVRLAENEINPSYNQWREYLGEKLPSFMIPSGIIEVSAIPLSTSGKIDRSALKALVPKGSELIADSSKNELSFPKNELECHIAEVWSSVLKTTPIHREDNFFALGGHSLLAIEVAYKLEQKLGRDVPARELFIEPTLAGFAERLQSNSCTNSTKLTEAASDKATVGQQEFWTAEKAGLDTRGFNISLSLKLHGSPLPSDSKWLDAWKTLLARHDVLRTAFYEDESGVLRRLVSTQAIEKFKLETAETFDQAKAMINTYQSLPFLMGKAGLCRAGLIRVSENTQTIFWFVMHHSVGDGQSLGILIDELNAILNGETLSQNLHNFSQSAAMEESYFAGESSQTDANFWKNHLHELVTDASDVFDEWPLDTPRPGARNRSTLKGSHCFRGQIDEATSNQLRLLAQNQGTTLHALMLTILGHEVCRRTGRSKFLLGTAASTRNSASEATLMGYYVNMLPLLFGEKNDSSINSSLEVMKQELARTLQHVRYPFAKIYSDFRLDNSIKFHPARFPLFDFAVTENPAMENQAPLGLYFRRLDGINESAYELRSHGPSQDMVLIHEEKSDKSTALTWYVNSTIYSKETAGAWFNSLIAWMKYLGRDSISRTTNLPLLLPSENDLLEQWQSGPILKLPATSFPDLFRKIAEEMPEKPALLTVASKKSYADIDRISNHVAHTLVTKNYKKGDVIGVFTERSALLPELVLGIWKAGCCYLPLASNFPTDRLVFMTDDAKIKCLIVVDDLELPPELNQGTYPVVHAREMAKCDLSGKEDIDARKHYVPVKPNDLAYIIYTSGSTGTPKGVLLSHGGLANSAIGLINALDLNSSDKIMSMASPSFDLWISDIIMTWGSGAALVPVTREEMNDLKVMHSILKKHQVSFATMSPSYLRLFNHEELRPLKKLMTVGEPPVMEDVKFYSTRLSYYNGYGPTEGTAGATIGLINRDFSQHCTPISAGKPFINTEVFIVDDKGKQVVPGNIGEVWLAGAGLAKGYLNRPDLTEKAFVVKSGKRFYRTGDLGRWLPNGNLLILGRLDNQIKLRGQRLELGEIEHNISSFPGVSEAVVLVDKQPDNKLLRAFFTMNKNLHEPSRQEWNTFLSARLPEFMIPSSITRVEEIPLTAAGKVNSPQLLLMLKKQHESQLESTTNKDVSRNKTAPRTEIEKHIARIWAEKLACSGISLEDNFFELGGDSLRAIAVIGQLSSNFECKVNALYEKPILADFAATCSPRANYLQNLINSVYAELFSENEKQTEVIKQAKALSVAPASSNTAIREKVRLKDQVNSDRFAPQREVYQAKIEADAARNLDVRRDYKHVLLTGATGYLGSYLLRELMKDVTLSVSVIVRSDTNKSATLRLREALSHYFGNSSARAICDDSRLTIITGDLRSEQLGLTENEYNKLASGIDAIYHSAANVNHIGYYSDFYADNVSATQNLLHLASLGKPVLADFHFMSTLSVCGSTSTANCQLFTEFDNASEKPDENYYIRTKQEAEHLVVEARKILPNASIYRIGNITFASDSGCLQRNIKQNAFFRQIVSFIELGAVPEEIPAALSHVNLVASAVAVLSRSGDLSNEIYHIETSRQDRLADFIGSANGMKHAVKTMDLRAFLDYLKKVLTDPGKQAIVAETVENMGLKSENAALSRRKNLRIVSDRTHALLRRLGVEWPEIPEHGQAEMLKKAEKIIAKRKNEST